MVSTDFKSVMPRDERGRWVRLPRTPANVIRHEKSQNGALGSLRRFPRALTIYPNVHGLSTHFLGSPISRHGRRSSSTPVLIYFAWASQPGNIGLARRQLPPNSEGKGPNHAQTQGDRNSGHVWVKGGEAVPEGTPESTGPAHLTTGMAYGISR